MYTTARQFCTVLGIDPPLEQADWPRSLRMDTRKAQAGGLVFDTTQEGIRRCVADYGLTDLL